MNVTTSQVPYRSTNWPSAKRKKLMPRTSNGLPVGGMPKNSPRWRPLPACPRRQPRCPPRPGPRPSTWRSGKRLAEGAHVLDQRARSAGRDLVRSGRRVVHVVGGDVGRRQREVALVVNATSCAQSTQALVLGEHRRVMRVGAARRPAGSPGARCRDGGPTPASGGIAPIWLSRARMSGCPQCSTILPPSTRKIPCDPHRAPDPGRRECP